MSAHPFRSTRNLLDHFEAYPLHNERLPANILINRNFRSRLSCVDSARAVMQNFDAMDERSTRVHLKSGSRQL
jgi:hypothetical protein